MGKRIRRSILYVPSDDPKLVKKAPGTDADALLYELEDGIAPRDKIRARENLSVVSDLDLKSKELCVRINSIGTEFWLDDVRAALDIGVDTIVVPKLDAPWQLRTVVEILEQSDAENVQIIIYVERPEGWAALDEIVAVCGEYPRVTGVVPGNEFTAMAGGSLDPESMDRVREHIDVRLLSVAPMGEVDLFAGTYLELEAETPQRRYAERSRDLGYMGQIALSPSQVEIINDVYTPTAEEYNRAKRLVQEFEAADTGGILTDENLFVDKPVAEAYEQVIERYELVQEFR